MIVVNVYVWGSALFVSLGGFLLGYDVGSMSGVLNMEGYRLSLNLSYAPDSIANSSSNVTSCDSQDDVHTAAIIGLIASLLSVGSLIGTLLSGVLSDVIGRKVALFIGASVEAFGGLLHTAAVNLWMVLLARIISGLGLGILFQVTSLYVAEISPERQRGRLLSVLGAYLLVGVLAGSLLNIAVKDYLFGWRISVGVQFAVGALLALGILFLPRSPRMLVKKQKEEKALKILTKIYKDQEKAQLQLEEIKAVVNTAKEPLLETLRYVFQWKIFQRVLLVLFMNLLGRFSGANFITTFSVLIFCGIGLPGFLASIALAVTGLLSLVLSLVVIDKFGRKPLFLFGVAVMCLCHIASAGLIMAFDLENTSPDTITTSQRISGYFVLVLICLFLGSTAISAGNIPWVITGEIFPLKGKGFMVSISTIGFWLGAIITNQVAAILSSSALQISGTLFLFAAMAFVLFLYVLLLLPETKGQTLETVDELFSQPWWKRVNVMYYLCCGCLTELCVSQKKEDEQPLDKGPTGSVSSTESDISKQGVEEETEMNNRTLQDGDINHEPNSITKL